MRSPHSIQCVSLLGALFAFKHEGTNLAIACEALKRIDPADLLLQLRETPNGAYIRKACYLWEQFTGQTLEDLPQIGGPTEPLFDPQRYVTLPNVKRDRRWRVAFNGLGTSDTASSSSGPNRSMRERRPMSWAERSLSRRAARSPCWIGHSPGPT